MRIISFNMNGIRAAGRKGFFTWLKTQNADVVCLQETKAHMSQLKDTDPMYSPEGYYCYYFDAEKKGYSGVGLYTKVKPKEIHEGLGWQTCDTEGRCLRAEFKNFSIASLYMPSGTSGPHRQELKYEFMHYYEACLEEIRKNGEDIIICGDWNIAHKEIDLKNWRSNQKNSGFLPEERAWLDKVFGQLNFVDAFRVCNQKPDQYTWWSQRSKSARANNIGWRIDYQIVTPNFKDKIKQVAIYTDENFSDHAPLIIDYDIKLE